MTIQISGNFVPSIKYFIYIFMVKNLTIKM